MNPSQSTLLIVDDTQLNRLILTKQLKKEGYNVLTAESGEIALEIIKSNPIDLVLLDVVMADMDGIAVLKILRESHSLLNLPIMMVTSKSESDDIVAALEHGANDYLTKPIDLPVAMARIRTHLLVKRLEDELERQRGRSFAMAKTVALGEMAGGIAHEINNPLAIICAGADLLKGMVQKQCSDEKIELLPLIERIEKTGYRIARIVKGLNQFSRNAEHDEWVESEVGTFISDAVVLCDPRLKAENINLISNVSAVHVKIKCRAVELSQVIYYLLTNACEAVATLPERWIQVLLEDLEKEVKISITDSGHGIAESVAEKIFQPFFTTKNVGTGLGLSIAQGVIESHHGMIELEADSPNTRFTIRLPKNGPTPLLRPV